MDPSPYGKSRNHQDRGVLRMNVHQRRLRSDSCINNVQLSLNCTKDYNNHSYPYIHAKSDPCFQINNRHSDPGCKTGNSCSKQDIKNEIYGKSYADCHRKFSKAARTSLDNFSANPWGKNKCNFDKIDDHSSLRRSRSLASSGEQLYSRLEFYTNTQEDGQLSGRRRSQLIPRAKLIKEHNRYRNLSVDNLNNSLEKQDRYKSRRYSNSTQTLQELTACESFYFEKQYHRENDLYSYTSLQNIHENATQQDSLDSNLNNNSSIANISYEDLAELSLPNYYPEARYDTDNTDNISLTDNISSVSLDNASKYKDIKYEYESISYDENIVLTPNKNLYESQENKIRTIRNPTPFNENYGTVNPNPIKTPEVLISEQRIEKIDTNLDEINLKVENITKNTHPVGQSIEKFIKVSLNVQESTKTPIKTLLEVSGKDVGNEQYKTVVNVDSATEKGSISDESCKESKSHSHNYLREFLESQKGSKKPLQNFITKKLSNLSRKTSKASTNLTQNQFHSLPDITVSKNLRKCEKIDRKLRKCNKNKVIQSNDTSKENRFIVNIGRHFDITENTSQPVDFEVKIAKISKKQKNESQSESEKFLEAVKQLKDSLNEHRISSTDSEMALLYCQDECNKELQEKMGTIKNYWNKVIGNDKTEDENKEELVEVTPKVEHVKKIFETNNEPPQETLPNKVQLVKQIFEPKLSEEKSGKISPNIKESCSYFENKNNNYNNDKYQSLCPNSVEIVHANKDTVDGDKPYKSLKQSNSITGKPEFDHVRYKLIKSDLFQKKIFANCDKDCEFDDLIQYLQDYSFQELLVDNNIVIIEPIRSKVSYEPSPCVKNMKNVTTSLRKTQVDNNDNKSSLNRKFFYHPIRVNKEVNEDELPSPDTVRQVRQLFEEGTLKHKNNQSLNGSYKENNSPIMDPDKDRCSATDSNSHPSNVSDFGSQENLYDSIDNNGIYCEYVSEDILQKIRERGTSVTYYGGRVVDKKTGQSVLTKTIMDEIKFNEKRCMECPNCKKNESEAASDSYMGVKFKILKSNSCSSRLELVGTENLIDAKKKIVLNHKNITEKNNMKNRDGAREERETLNNKNNDKHAINESIKKQLGDQPKIIGEEMKVPESRVTQWKEISEKNNQKIYNFYEFDNIQEKSRKIEEMEFEPYEVA